MRYKYIISIDPQRYHLGLAVFEEGDLMAAYTVHSRDKGHLNLKYDDMYVFYRIPQIPLKKSVDGLFKYVKDSVTTLGSDGDGVLVILERTSFGCQDAQNKLNLASGMIIGKAQQYKFDFVYLLPTMWRRMENLNSPREGVKMAYQKYVLSLYKDASEAYKHMSMSEQKMIDHCLDAIAMAKCFFHNNKIFLENLNVVP